MEDYLRYISRQAPGKSVAISRWNVSMRYLFELQGFEIWKYICQSTHVCDIFIQLLSLCAGAERSVIKCRVYRSYFRSFTVHC